MKPHSRLKALTFLLLFTIFSLQIASAQSIIDQANKIKNALAIINTFYVDTFDRENIVEASIVAMLQELDPHSVYISRDELQRMNEPLEGNFEGIGIQFHILRDTLMVVNAIPGGPSEEVGIRAGDRIIKIDGQNVAGVGLTNQDVFDKLRGEKGTKVNVGIKRKSQDKLLNFNIVRDKIPIYSLDAAYMAAPGIGYIKLNRFSSTTMDEFSEALSKLKNQNMKSLILDLKGNGGGLLREAIELSDEFLENGRKILFTEGLASPRIDYNATGKGDWEKGKLIIMIDESSASASEIVSGAVQDWDRGLIIGRRSFGKGLVQRPFELIDGSAIRLTVAKYYTPTGRLIQKPYDKGYKEYYQEIGQRIQHGELENKDSISFPDSLKYETLISGRTVFGGGGIMPDIFVPADTSFYSEFYRDIIQQGILNQFVIDYVDNNRKDLQNQFPDFDTFDKNFEVSGSMFVKLQDMAEKEEIKTEDDIPFESAEMIRTQIKALIARDLWETNEYFVIINRKNEVFNKALETLMEKNQYSENLNQR